MDAQVSIERVSPMKEAVPVCCRELCGKCYDHFEALPLQIDGLFESNSRQSIFLSRVWFENLIHTSLNPGQKVRFFSVEAPSLGSTPFLLLPACTGRAEVFE